MAEPFLSEIRLMSFVFAPRGWALCDGQLLPINQNQALFSLLGTTFGGDGRVNFALPDLRGRTPIHVGSGHTLGERGGEQAHTLSIAEIPTHTHPGPSASSDVGNRPGSPAGNVAPARCLGVPIRIPRISLAMSPTTVTMHRWQPGASEHATVPHAQLLIALQGIFPSPN